MADETKSVRRAKLILLVVVLVCVAVSTSLIIAVIEGLLGGKRPGSAVSSPAAEDLKSNDIAVLASYGKSPACQGCHETEFREWAESHHALAERPVRDDSDRRAFDPARTMVENVRTSEVRVAEQKFEIVTTGLDGTNRAFVA